MSDWDSGPRIEPGLPKTTAADAADSIGPEAVLAVSGFGSAGYPKVIPLALAESERDLALTVISGGAVGDEIDTDLAGADAIARRYPFATRAAIRERANDGRTAFADHHVSGMSDAVRFGGLPSPDVAVLEAVAVGEGWFVPSTSSGSTPAYVAAADRLPVEVNDAQPRGLGALHDVHLRAPPPERTELGIDVADRRIGGPTVRFEPEKLAGVVRTDRPDATYEFREPTAADEAIAANLARFLTTEVERNPALEETLNLEFGVGSIGNAVVSAVADADLGGREMAYFGEVIQDGVLDALDAGRFSAASGTALALSAEGQDRLFADLEGYAEDVVLRPADVSNAASAIDRLGVVAVNGAAEVDVYGHVNSTHLRGSDLIGGLGGSGDYARNALVSIFALPATAAAGDVSRIVPMATHVDHTEHDVDVIVTDQGVADVRGLSPRERSREIVDACAHPDVRPALESYLERAGGRGGHEPHDLSTTFDWQ